MALKQSPDALMGVLSPVYPEGMESLNEIVGQMNVGRDDLSWIGTQIPGFFRMSHPLETSDGGHWIGLHFHAWDDSIVSVLFPIETARRDTVYLDRSIAMYGISGEGVLPAYLILIYSELLKLRITRRKHVRV